MTDDCRYYKIIVYLNIHRREYRMLYKLSVEHITETFCGQYHWCLGFWGCTDARVIVFQIQFLLILNGAGQKLQNYLYSSNVGPGVSSLWRNCISFLCLDAPKKTPQAQRENPHGHPLLNNAENIRDDYTTYTGYISQRTIYSVLKQESFLWTQNLGGLDASPRNDSWIENCTILCPIREHFVVGQAMDPQLGKLGTSYEPKTSCCAIGDCYGQFHSHFR
jgi:hypothetical protein